MTTEHWAISLYIDFIIRFSSSITVKSVLAKMSVLTCMSPIVGHVSYWQKLFPEEFISNVKNSYLVFQTFFFFNYQDIVVKTSTFNTNKPFPLFSTTLFAICKLSNIFSLEWIFAKCCSLVRPEAEQVLSWISVWLRQSHKNSEILVLSNGRKKTGDLSMPSDLPAPK